MTSSKPHAAITSPFAVDGGRKHQLPFLCLLSAMAEHDRGGTRHCGTGSPLVALCLCLNFPGHGRYHQPMELGQTLHVCVITGGIDRGAGAGGHVRRTTRRPHRAVRSQKCPPLIE